MTVDELLAKLRKDRATALARARQYEVDGHLMAAERVHGQVDAYDHLVRLLRTIWKRT